MIVCYNNNNDDKLYVIWIIINAFYNKINNFNILK